MNKDWMRAPRSSNEYAQGLSKFIDSALATSVQNNRILCPCKKCGNNYWLGVKDVRYHLLSDGFMAGYKSWIHHGEDVGPSVPGVSSTSIFDEVSDAGDAIDQMLMEGFGMYDTRCLGGESDDEMDVDAEAYYKLVDDGSQELYPGCQWFSKLQFLVRLLNIKSSAAHHVEGDSTSKKPNKVVQSTPQTMKMKTTNCSLYQEQSGKQSIQIQQEKIKKPRKFQAPFDTESKDVVAEIKCGMDVGLSSPNSRRVVAFGTVDQKAKATDGQPLADYVWVVITMC